MLQHLRHPRNKCLGFTQLSFFLLNSQTNPPLAALAPGARQLTCGKHLGLHASSASDQVSMLVDSRSRMLLLLDLMASSAFMSSAWAVS